MMVGALNDRYILKADSIGQLKRTASRICNRNKTMRDRLRITGDAIDVPIIFCRENIRVGIKHFPGKWIKQ